jgi:hypothetical protein
MVSSYKGREGYTWKRRIHMEEKDTHGREGYIWKRGISSHMEEKDTLGREGYTRKRRIHTEEKDIITQTKEYLQEKAVLTHGREGCAHTWKKTLSSRTQEKDAVCPP